MDPNSVGVRLRPHPSPVDDSRHRLRLRDRDRLEEVRPQQPANVQRSARVWTDCWRGNHRLHFAADPRSDDGVVEALPVDLMSDPPKRPDDHSRPPNSLEINRFVYKELLSWNVKKLKNTVDFDGVFYLYYNYYLSHNQLISKVLYSCPLE